MPRSHECPGGCGLRVPGHRLACRDCWYRLPRELRQAVSASYRRSGERHQIALADAYQWYATNPLLDQHN